MWRTDAANQNKNTITTQHKVNRICGRKMICYYYSPYFLAVLLLFFVVSTEQSVTCAGEKCRLMRDVLRDPHRLSHWKPSSLNRAIHQLRAYEQLFQEDKRSSQQFGPLIDVMRL
ncbi:unnamed protein product [Caenorhabditis angaria]|uniref:Uncharacterized protein n=1 Tax=Caenorhabditis angaria TaxID=860376 RepID=A0A9P1IH07_9PELO|nr:unnamed protein product [Caenorhabditis angaria]